MENEWYKIPTQTKINAYTQIAEEKGMTPFAIEKYWWVVQTLSAIFEMEIGTYLIFKGGTSLCKAWNLIERFSEDIDLAFDRTFLGFDGVLNRTQIKKLRKVTGKFSLTINQIISDETLINIFQKSLNVEKFSFCINQVFSAVNIFANEGISDCLVFPQINRPFK